MDWLWVAFTLAAIALQLVFLFGLVVAPIIIMFFEMWDEIRERKKREEWIIEHRKRLGQRNE